MNALHLATQTSLLKSSDRTARVAAREQRDRNRATSTGKFVSYDASSGKHKLELPDGSIVATDYESNAGLRQGETVGVVMPKYATVGKSYKLPR